MGAAIKDAVAFGVWQLQSEPSRLRTDAYTTAVEAGSMGKVN
jgi:hypothetical protein